MLNDLLVYVKEVPRKGRAIFSTKNIEKDTAVLIGRPVDALTERTWLCLIETVNHSCRPNCSVKHNEYGGYTLVALRFIPKNEEIVYDYAMTEWDCVGNFNCMCGEKNCRHNTIGANTVNRTLLKSYLPYISDYIAQKLDHSNHAACTL